MTDPTPTRAEVARYTAAGYDPGMKASHEGAWVSFTDYQALRERAEAAERHKDAGWDQQRYWCDRYDRKTAALEKELVEARRAEAAAWNDAIEAAAEKCDVASMDHIGDIVRGIGDDIRALRRAAPTEGEA